MTIENWPIVRVKPYPRNARKIGKSAVDKVAASLSAYGWQQPIVVDSEGVVIAGHTRLLAARQLGMIEVPVHVASELTAAQTVAYRLMDNRSHDETKWDLQMIGPELLDLKGLDFDLTLTGFEAHEITDFLSTSKGSEDAAQSEASEKGGRTASVDLSEAQVYWLLQLLKGANEPARARASYHALRRKLNQAALKD